jgi:hypothetical protein
LAANRFSGVFGVAAVVVGLDKLENVMNPQAGRFGFGPRIVSPNVCKRQKGKSGDLVALPRGQAKLFQYSLCLF